MRGGRTQGRGGVGACAVVLAVAAVAVAALGACDEGTCPDGSVPSEGRCVPEACGACPAATPRCDVDRCVACLVDEDCAPDRPRCGEDRACRGCVEDADCTRAEAPVCGAGGACVPCAGDGDCARLAATPYCAPTVRRCVACLPESEADDCAGTACDPVDLRCTERALGSGTWCTPCLSDSECASGLACVETAFDGVPVGTHCLEAFDPNACGRREGRPARLGPSRSGAPPAEYCAPAVDVSCPAWADGLAGTRCESDAACGAPGLDDGVCRAGRCTVRCRALPCPWGVACTDAVCSR